MASEVPCLRLYVVPMNLVDWWGTIDWGNASGWASAVFSSVSVSIALWVVLRDSRGRRREAADAVTSWLLEELSASDEVERITVQAVNSGSHLVTRCRVVWDPAKQVQATPLMGRKVTIENWEILRPGEQIYQQAPKDLTYDQISGMGFLHFTDYKVAIWYRELGTDKYMSERAVYRRWRGRRKAPIVT